jgi:hypothetical protein
MVPLLVWRSRIDFSGYYINEQATVDAFTADGWLKREIRQPSMQPAS